ncbi:hypothetical protein M885DRAFT_610815 [Pelagophyceae sp. CCMP2097]|nr:hypothetical protein M885DRAFT_610815 [Pelagophyceae sp. CCMP2097]
MLPFAPAAAAGGAAAHESALLPLAPPAAAAGGAAARAAPALPQALPRHLWRRILVVVGWPEDVSAALVSCRASSAAADDAWSDLADSAAAARLATALLAARRLRGLRTGPDFSRLACGARTRPLRRALMREMLLRYLFCDDSSGRAFVGGDFALADLEAQQRCGKHENVRVQADDAARERTADLDFWVACETASERRDLPRRLAATFSRAVEASLGVKLRRADHGSSHASLRTTQPSRRRLRTAHNSTSRVEVDAYRLEYSVDDPGSRGGDGDGRAVEAITFVGIVPCAPFLADALGLAFPTRILGQLGCGAAKIGLVVDARSGARIYIEGAADPVANAPTRRRRDPFAGFDRQPSQCRPTADRPANDHPKPSGAEQRSGGSVDRASSTSSLTDDDSIVALCCLMPRIRFGNKVAASQ